MQIILKEFTKKEEMLAAFLLAKQRYRSLDLQSFSEALEEMIERNNYKMIAAFLGEELIGISGYWISYMLYCGRYLQASNFIVSEEKRRLGVGKKILSHLEEIAKNLDCKKMVLDSNTENKESHPLYFREGFYIRGFHFMKNIS